MSEEPVNVLREQRDRKIARAHIWCNVTDLVQELVDAESEWALELWHGCPESSQRAYPAKHIWVVSPTWAMKLRMREQRVEKLGEQYYWASEHGDLPYRDPVVRRIIESISSESKEPT